MLSTGEVRELLREFRIGEPLQTWCKPKLYLLEGYFGVFGVFGPRDVGPIIRMEIETPDTDGVRGLVNISGQHRVPDASLANASTFYAWCRFCVVSILTHEADEAITISGMRVYDPHTPAAEDRLKREEEAILSLPAPPIQGKRVNFPPVKLTEYDYYANAQVKKFPPVNYLLPQPRTYPDFTPLDAAKERAKIDAEERFRVEPKTLKSLNARKSAIRPTHYPLGSPKPAKLTPAKTKRSR